MAEEKSREEAPVQYPVYRLTTHRRTISETDIINFVNLAGLHEPIFIDMEYIQEKMAKGHQKRFAPAAFIIGVGMGLVATKVVELLDKVLKDETVGPSGGLVGINAKVMHPVYPGDTLHVELEAGIKKKTSRGYTLIDLRHMIKNQRDEIVIDFIETAIRLPLEKK